MSEMRFQRISFLNLVSEKSFKSCPSKSMLPSNIRPFVGSNRSRVRAMLDFPLPDSPAMPSTCPFSNEKETSSTACTSPSLVAKYILRSFTSRRAKQIFLSGYLSYVKTYEPYRCRSRGFSTESSENPTKIKAIDRRAIAMPGGKNHH